MKLLLVQPELSYPDGRDNAGVVTRLVEPHADSLGPDDIVVLPEHFDLRSSRSAYESDILGLAKRIGCHVVGGSHHEERGTHRINSGIVADSRGQIVGTYEKLRPYADERHIVREGTKLGELRIGGRSVLVLICADFWFSDVFYRATELPDLVLVPALSVTRKPTPDYSRALWKHLAVTRSYEFGTYVGISDWAYIENAGVRTSGVGGIANPTPVDPARLFRPIDGTTRLYDLDFEALDTFRQDRTARGFFWKKPG